MRNAARTWLAIVWVCLGCGCDSLAGTLDYGNVPLFPSRAPEEIADSCADLTSTMSELLLTNESAAPAVAGLQARAARTYYVRPYGDDAASGESEEQAWRSIERVNQQQLGPGSSVLFEAGATFSGELRIERDDGGALDAPLAIGSFGQGRARIEAGAGTAIAIVDASGVVVSDLVLHGDWDAMRQSGNAGSGVRAENTLGGGSRLPLLRLQRLEISGFREAGIAIFATPPDGAKRSGYEGVEIAHSDVHDNGDVGVVLGGPFSDEPGYSHRGVLVHHVRTYRNRGLVDKEQHTGSGIVLSDVDGAAIERCVAHDNGEFNDKPGGGGFGIWAWDANAVVIQHNESYGNKSQTADGGGFDLDGGVTHSWLQYNYSHDNHGAGFGAFQFPFARPSGANVIRYNISQNDGVGFLLWDGNGDLEGLAIHNNVSYGRQSALVTYSRLDDVRLLHNVFYATAALLIDVAEGEGVTLQGNAYFSADAPLRMRWNAGSAREATYDSFDAFRAGSLQEQHDGVATGLHIDPRLNAPGSAGNLDDAERLRELDAYRLADDSPLIDRGLDLVSYDLEPGCQDFFGNPIPHGDALDIGAHEHQ